MSWQEEFQWMSEIHEGISTLVQVHRFLHLPTQTEVAVKLIPKTSVHEKQLVRLKTEKQALINEIQSPFIVTLIRTHQDEENLYFVYELLPGNTVFDHQKEVLNRIFSDAACRYVVGCVALGLETIHNHGYIHRDIKLSNLCLTLDGRVKIIDFGFIKKLGKGERADSIVGTRHCMAPEIVGASAYGKEVDWWSLGIVLYELAVGRPPFWSNDRKVLEEHILMGEYYIPKHVDSNLADLIQQLLQYDPSQRLSSLSALISHSFFENFDWDALKELRMKVPEELTTKSEHGGHQQQQQLENAVDPFATF